MSVTRQLVQELVDQLAPFDALEAEHRDDVLRWLDSGADVYRTARPATPPKHLVSYCVLVDSVEDHVLLVDHRDARLWLPTGGHVEPGERPCAAAVREMREELGVSPPFHRQIGESPLFVTVTETGGLSKSHTDVSLWFVFEGSVSWSIEPDEREFRGVRWWPFDEIVPASSVDFDPHLPRFVAKLRARLG